MTDPYKSPRWARVRQQVLERDGFACQIRGPKCQGVATEVDHIVPWRDGGAWYDLANLRAACSWCNTWRAQQQKARIGWKRAKTHIVLVVGPPGSCEHLSQYVREHASPGDLIVDYRTISAAVGGSHEEVKRLRGMLLTQLRHGDVKASRAWVTSTNPRAEEMFPHHEVVVIDPGEEEALKLFPERPDLVRDWYRYRTRDKSESRW